MLIDVDGRPNNLEAMKNVYAGLPKVSVKPLHFAAQDISGERLLTMMKVEEHGKATEALKG